MKCYTKRRKNKQRNKIFFFFVYYDISLLNGKRKTHDTTESNTIEDFPSKLRNERMEES